MKKSYDLCFIIQTAYRTIYDKKGFNILALDVHGICSITDSFIIAEGNVERHVQALCNALLEELGKLGKTPFYIEGGGGDSWIVMDYGDLLIHLMTSEMREKYKLEQIWHEGKVIDIPLDIKHKA